jgi:hypothetical protein
MATQKELAALANFTDEAIITEKQRRQIRKEEELADEVYVAVVKAIARVCDQHLRAKSCPAEVIEAVTAEYFANLQGCCLGDWLTRREAEKEGLRTRV